VTETVLAVTAIGHRGDGLASHGGATVHVPGALPGETVAAEIAGGRAIVTRIVTASPERAAPFCPHYESCGGCQLQHWQEGPYRSWKKGLVEQALRSRDIAVPVRELIDARGAGRRRVSIHVRRKDGNVTAGFMAARSHRLLDLDRCPVLADQLGRAFDLARAIGARAGDCDVALTATAGGIDAGVKAERRVVEPELPKFAALAAQLQLARLSINGNPVVTLNPPLVPMGRANVIIPPGSFLQATAAGETELARLACGALGKARTVADLFCGCGPFAFRLAERAKVWGYDSDHLAIAALAAAARITSGLKPIAAATRDLFREPLVTNELKAFDAVVFDPPRAGAEAQARQLAKSAVRTVVAVSCDPASFARDAQILVGGGYHLAELTAVDQFKWTSHVEIVAVFRKS